MTCAQFVPNSGAFLIIPAHSSARSRRHLLLQWLAVMHTYANTGLGLKILCSSHDRHVAQASVDLIQ